MFSLGTSMPLTSGALRKPVHWKANKFVRMSGEQQRFIRLPCSGITLEKKHSAAGSGSTKRSASCAGLSKPPAAKQRKRSKHTASELSAHIKPKQVSRIAMKPRPLPVIHTLVDGSTAAAGGALRFVKLKPITLQRYKDSANVSISWCISLKLKYKLDIDADSAIVKFLDLLYMPMGFTWWSGDTRCGGS